MRHQPCHEACAEVFEGEGRAVEEFQDVVVGREGDERGVELQGAVYDLQQIVRRDIFSEKGLRHGISDFLET